MVKRGDMLALDDVTDILAIEVLGVVPDDEAIVASSNRGEPATADNNSKAGQAFKQIARRILGETIPLTDPAAKKGFFAKLFGSKN
jgi:septum site-determining protein MinD